MSEHLLSREDASQLLDEILRQSGTNWSLLKGQTLSLAAQHELIDRLHDRIVLILQNSVQLAYEQGLEVGKSQGQQELARDLLLDMMRNLRL